MFTSIQKKLLLEKPLLWNTKFIPMVILGMAFHIVQFFLGWFQGTIDFTNKTKVNIEFSAISFGILAVIITIILWLVAYFKNNSFKSFYKKSKNSLFYEWLQLFVVIFLLSSFYLSFSMGRQLHERSYYSYEDTQKRCEIIANADIFIDGFFKGTEVDSLASGLIDSLGNKTAKLKRQEIDSFAAATDEELIYKDYILFKGKKYKEYSLLNRGIHEFSIISEEADSLNEIKVKNWLFGNDITAVKKLMTDYLGLINEHQLKTNLTLETWFEATYKSPKFDSFLYISPYFKEYETYNSYRYHQYETSIVKPYDVKYSKYYIQQDILKDKYETVSVAHTNNLIDFDAVIVFLYLALSCSLLLFSFRVSSGKSWLIALVSLGIINVIIGIFGALGSSSSFYFGSMLAFFIGISIYYVKIYVEAKRKEISGIILNLILWLSVYFIPIIYNLITDYYKKSEYKYGYDYVSPEYTWLREHFSTMFVLNFIFMIFVLFLLSRMIRNWKGIAEN